MSRTAPAWTQHAIWWHVYPLGFTGADTTGVDRTARGGGLERVTGWLDHVVELGANGLALGPVFESGSHGYDTVSHWDIDTRLGDRAAFDRLVAAAHDRGISVMLDGVFNHVGNGFHARAAPDGDDRPLEDWLRHRRDGERELFEGHPGLLNLDHDSPQVQDYVVEVMNHWLAAGADAWRLDAAYAVRPDFWAAVLPRVHDAHPDAWIVGEVLHGDYAAYVRDSGLDSVTQYELWKAIWSSLGDRNFFELAWALTRHDGFAEVFAPHTFVGNHDVTRLASRIEDARHRPHALAVLFTVAGVPAVYYGDELGLTGVKEDRVGGDDAVRPAFPSGPGPLPPEQDAVLRVHQQLIAVRRRHPWLHHARTEAVTLTNTALVLRTSADGESLVVALNLDDAPLQLDAGLAVETVLAGVAERAGGAWRVPPHGWAVLR